MFTSQRISLYRSSSNKGLEQKQPLQGAWFWVLAPPSGKEEEEKMQKRPDLSHWWIRPIVWLIPLESLYGGCLGRGWRVCLWNPCSKSSAFLSSLWLSQFPAPHPLMAHSLWWGRGLRHVCPIGILYFERIAPFMHLFILRWKKSQRTRMETGYCLLGECVCVCVCVCIQLYNFLDKNFSGLPIS